jgi:hypothetical protein
MIPRDSLEDRFLWIIKGGVFGSGLLLAAGLALHLARPDQAASGSLLAGGLVVLMGVPAARLLLASAERIRRRDWLFLLATLIIVIELSLTMWFASRRM